MDQPIETAELLAFKAIVATRSFSRAARDLGVPRATIGRRLSRLEERLGVRLIHRTTRRVTLTDAGDAFHRNAIVAIEAVQYAEDSVRRQGDSISGPLRVSMPQISDPIQKMICDFASKYPSVQIQTHFTTRVVDLQRDGYDVALRATSTLAPGLVARTLMRGRLLAIASPSYLKKHGTPKKVSDLRSHRLLLGFERGEIPQTYWPLVNGRKVRVDGVFFSNELLVLREAVVRSLGITLLPDAFVESHLAKGTLVHVLPEIGAVTQVALVYLEKELMPPQVRAFIEHVTAWAPKGMVEMTRSRRS